MTFFADAHAACRDSPIPAPLDWQIYRRAPRADPMRFDYRVAYRKGGGLWAHQA